MKFQHAILPPHTRASVPPSADETTRHFLLLFLYSIYNMTELLFTREREKKKRKREMKEYIEEGSLPLLTAPNT